jgi:hypothetical protein
MKQESLQQVTKTTPLILKFCIKLSTKIGSNDTKKARDEII